MRGNQGSAAALPSGPADDPHPPFFVAAAGLNDTATNSQCPSIDTDRQLPSLKLCRCALQHTRQADRGSGFARRTLSNFSIFLEISIDGVMQSLIFMLLERCSDERCQLAGVGG
ncbi:MAG: hypothetical protein ACXIUO_02140 [Erythrobacter sp.]